MKRIIYLFFIVIVGLFMILENVKALGGYLTGDYGQVAPVEVRAIIDFDGKTEIITATQTFSFNPLTINNFYWVMAFPDEAEINIPKTKEDLLKDEFFDLDKKTQKKFAKDNIFQKILYPDIIEEKFEQAQTFSREAWVKNAVSAPKFRNMNELEAWFKNNAYSIPKTSKEIFAKYREKGWPFEIVEVDGLHLETDAKESLTINGAHTIPIQIKFKSDKIILPLEFIKIQPDRDSINIPLSFEYGSSSSEVLGVKDVKVDNLLSSQSSNLYPPLLLDLMSVKVDLFVRANYKVTGYNSIPGFTTVFADKVDGKYVTRIVGYIPLTQLEDITIEKAKDQRRVNPQIGWLENLIRLLLVVYIGIRLLKYLTRKKITANVKNR